MKLILEIIKRFNTVITYYIFGIKTMLIILELSK